MAKTKVLIDVNVGPQLPPEVAWLVWATPFTFDSGTTVVLPSGTNVDLRSGQGEVDVDPGVWIVTVVAPNYIRTQGWIVPESATPVQFADLLEANDRDMFEFGPTWAARAELAALNSITVAAEAKGYRDEAKGYRDQAQQIVDGFVTDLDVAVTALWENPSSDFRWAVDHDQADAIADPTSILGVALRTWGDERYARAFPTSVAITYDTAGNVQSVTENDVVTTYAYNTDGTVHTDTRLGVTRTYTYDGSGNPTGIAS